MASPVAHTLVGLAFGLAWFLPRRRRSWRQVGRDAVAARGPLAGCALLANAPDIDYLFGIPFGDLNRLHQYSTHTLGWVLVLVVGLWLLWIRRRSDRPWLKLLFLFALGVSHLALDLITEDTGAPFGIPALWPFAGRRIFLPDWAVFWYLGKRNWGSLVSWHNAGALLREIAFTLPLPLVILWLKTRRPAGSPAPGAASEER
jgi:membrane-bound metal-dependent hydrolase YbcI (DUF457 family)